MGMKEQNVYSYSPSAAERAKEIRKEFEKEKTPLEELEALRNMPYTKANAWCFPIGILAVLVLGFGMVLCLEWTSYFWYGVVIGLIGLALAAGNYFLYIRLLNNYKDEVRAEIMKRSELIINGN